MVLRRKCGVGFTTSETNNRVWIKDPTHLVLREITIAPGWLFLNLLLNFNFILNCFYISNYI